MCLLGRKTVRPLHFPSPSNRFELEAIISSFARPYYLGGCVLALGAWKAPRNWHGEMHFYARRISRFAQLAPHTLFNPSHFYRWHISPIPSIMELYSWLSNGFGDVSTGGGSKYVKHRDAAPSDYAGRKLTCIYYLNDNWQVRAAPSLSLSQLLFEL